MEEFDFGEHPIFNKPHWYLMPINTQVQTWGEIMLRKNNLYRMDSLFSLWSDPFYFIDYVQGEEWRYLRKENDSTLVFYEILMNKVGSSYTR